MPMHQIWRTWWCSSRAAFCKAASMGSSDRGAVVAARNNSQWCDAVCRSHGLPGSFAPDAWTNPRRTPPYYPDAVTLQPAAGPETILARVDTTSGCTIKDSFSCLDLSGLGFHVLFDAEWIYRPARPSRATATVRSGWVRVATSASLALWEKAWAANDAAPGLFRPELLADESIVILGRMVADCIVAGAIANLAEDVVGVSNVFTTTSPEGDSWTSCVEAIAERFPGRPIVGYESGATLVAAQRCGFSSVGPVRVWSNGNDNHRDS